jgi:hypothetical protein
MVFDLGAVYLESCSWRRSLKMQRQTTAGDAESESASLPTRGVLINEGRPSSALLLRGACLFRHVIDRAQRPNELSQLACCTRQSTDLTADC